MAGSVNKVTLLGNLGADPEIRSTQDGKEIANLRLATTESWRDKNTGERKEKTEWHRVVIFSQGLVNVVKQYVKKDLLTTIRSLIETILIAFIGWILLTIKEFHIFLIQNMWILIPLLMLNFFIGKYKELNLKEILRFKKIFSNE